MTPNTPKASPALSGITYSQVMSALALVPHDKSHPDRCRWIADYLNNAPLSPAQAEPLGQAGAYERIGYIHEGDKFIYPTRGKPSDKPVYIRVGLPPAPTQEPAAIASTGSTT